ncbi:glycosyltransferase family 4 protein [Olleya sp. Bg11-27]|uniref:glycosyltransferase family 4 protein n=1 Tax=Olleya sp. Bg11-27 TaxID=2058135 RepID=UPI000C30629E|nr:glycosyltransferase family 1 protein [Olleya sp. Bg11-27]AUC75610.1 glycosyltransferase family 1 protein [Olleya sp. Bg11-27]
MKHVFLESHNIKNQFNGFGQFNYHLIKGLQNANITDFKMTLHAKDTNSLKDQFGNYFDYKTYRSISRKPLFRIRKKYDVWHSLNQNIKIEPYHKIPYVLTVHDVNFISEVSKDLNHDTNKRFIEKLNRSSAITYISEFAKTATHQHFNVPKVPEYVIYNGNPITTLLDLKNTKIKPVSDRPYLFFIGGLTQRKNVHTLVQMLEHLPDYDLILAGDTSDSYVNTTLSQAISKTRTTNRVHMIGTINTEQKQYYLQNCSAFVFPSLLEGFGIPPIEAMRFGKPVFLSNLTSLPEIGGDQAFYWDNFDPKAMSEVFIKGMTSFESNKTNYSKASIKRALSFDWNTSAKQYADVYRSLL